MARKSDALEVVEVPVEQLKLDPKNARLHGPTNIEAIKASLDRFGQRKPIVVSKNMTVVAGNGTLEAAIALGWPTLAVTVFPGTPAEARAYAIADNHTADLSTWDNQQLLDNLQSLSAPLLAATAFTQPNVDRLLASLRDPDAPELPRDPGLPDDELPPVPVDPVTKVGDIWQLGPHRVMCGDCTSSDNVATLGAGEADLVLTDPPYCSGGFQESGKSAGSVGTNATHKQIANDKLSTRGYIALIRRTLENTSARYAYIFTDWRMWVNLFDVVEGSGFGVRSMIVWDKSTPGMGRGWRSQHELMMWACKDTPAYPKSWPANGNVIQAKRSGNNLHTTQKPVDLIIALIHNSPFARMIYDPFGGSGTTLMAAHEAGLPCRVMELDPAYVDVICRRFQEWTGILPTRDGVEVDFVGH